MYYHNTIEADNQVDINYKKAVLDTIEKSPTKQLENSFSAPQKAELAHGWYYCYNCGHKIAKHMSGLNFSLEIRCANRDRKNRGKICGKINIVDM
jgi:hypothetical protein